MASKGSGCALRISRSRGEHAIARAKHQAKPIGVPALISLYEKMIKDNPLLRQLKVSVDYGEVMPNIPQMGRFFSAVGAAIQIATQGQASAQAALQEAEGNMRHQ